MHNCFDNLSDDDLKSLYDFVITSEKYNDSEKERLTFAISDEIRNRNLTILINDVLVQFKLKSGDS